MFTFHLISGLFEAINVSVGITYHDVGSLVRIQFLAINLAVSFPVEVEPLALRILLAGFGAAIDVISRTNGQGCGLGGSKVVVNVGFELEDLRVLWVDNMGFGDNIGS